MTIHVLKTTPYGNRYAVWTTPVGTYLAIGSRAEIEQWGCYFGQPITAEMFARADAAGTSDPGGSYGFDTTGIHVGTVPGVPPELLPGVVPRNDLEAFVLAAEDGDRDAVLRLSRHIPGPANGDA